MKKIIIWWGRSDPTYSRNQILRKILRQLNYKIIDFYPYISYFGYIQALFQIKTKPCAIWVPCFRQRDIHSASKWAKKNTIPLIFDPLISSWDKQVGERKKFLPNSFLSEKLKKKESQIFNKADFLIADTEAHKKFFNEIFNFPKNKIFTINVGADEKFFFPDFSKNKIHNEILFYGSFLELHGIDTILEAAKLTINKKIKWTLLGNYNKYKFNNLPSNIHLEKTIAISKLRQRIIKSTILLGIFSSSEKGNNVIPNKVFQSLACGKPVITRKADAYPKEIIDEKMGIYFVEPNNPNALAQKVIDILKDNKKILNNSKEAYKTFINFFSNKKIEKQIKVLLNEIKN